MTRLLVLSLLGTSGCVAFNDPCVPLVDNPNERVTFVQKGSEIWLDRANARHADNAIGQAETDAMVWVYTDTDHPVDLGIVNGGAIRAEGLCVTRNVVSAGALTNGVLHEILLFDNPVLAADLSEQEVLDMFEHSVAGLYADPAPIATPSGQFLQVSKEVSMTVDCSKAVGSRVTSLTIKGQPVQRPARPLSTVKYRTALSTYLAGGGDGYTMLAGKSTDTTRTPIQAQRYGGIDADITAAYLKQSSFNQTVEQGLIVDVNRVKFTNCSTAVRPQ
jgi:2',3'-cyclic-nucleotide 2'-phosphodiesterase (5'-nucleotidase family)